MRRPVALLVTATVLSTLVLANPAAADERTCRGSIGAETVDDLRVPDGADCRLEGTRVEGNIRVGTGASLLARQVRVDGNVQAEGHRDVDLRDSRVGGSVQLKQGGSAIVSATIIGGDLQYDDNARRLVAHANTVGGNIQIVGNEGGVDVSANRVDGNLQCEENRPAPTGGANTVRGNAEDQCARLTGGTASPAPGDGGSGASFSDTAGSVHEGNIEKVAAAGIALGGTDGRFRPNAPVTRGQMATFLQRGYRLEAGSTGFCDTRGHTHEAGIRAVAAAGIALGGEDGCFRPDASVNRGQVASFVQRAEGLAAASSRGFCDTRGTTHERAIDAVAAARIVEGSGGCYRPFEAMTRGQMASVLARALGL